MKLGPAIRRFLPHSIERRAAQLYRTVFVDLRKVAAFLADAVPPDASVLDIGGGDGELLNCLLALRPDIRVTMVDIAPSVGRFLEEEYRDRVRFFPRTPIETHLKEAAASYDAAIVSDVMHHIPTGFRPHFVHDIFGALKPGAPLFIKDIEPGYAIATLSLYSDLYVSGDKGVSLISMEQLTDLLDSVVPDYIATELGLFRTNGPNYLLKFSNVHPDLVTGHDQQANAANSSKYALPAR